MKQNFSSYIIDWYLTNKRDLPWRETKDPYTVWLSEIILQQTRVDQGLPYFRRFIESYPSIKAFSKAGEDDILKMWQGLGYYSRARNMLTCAKTIMTEHRGNFPDNYNDLLKLKGIGKYTAAAIASISFNEPVSVIDGNVYRVLSRIFGLENDLSNSKTYDVFFLKAQKLIDTERPDLFNQAIMEFGALHCTPRNPQCDQCIFSNNCFANKHDMQAHLPVKTKKIKKRVRKFNYFVVSYNDKLLIKKRPEGDVWSGLYDFLLIEEEDKNENAIKNEKFDFNLWKNDNLDSSSQEFKHILSHQTIFVTFYQVAVNSKDEFDAIRQDYSLTEITKDTLHQYPVSTLIQNYLKNDYF